jgi:hypothetical protein
VIASRLSSPTPLQYAARPLFLFFLPYVFPLSKNRIVVVSRMHLVLVLALIFRPEIAKASAARSAVCLRLRRVLAALSIPSPRSFPPSAHLDTAPGRRAHDLQRPPRLPPASLANRMPARVDTCSLSNRRG